MTPFFEQSGIMLYLGDCRDLLPNFAIVDLILTDPPYGHGKLWAGGTWGAQQKYQEAKSWDAVCVDDETIAAVVRAGRRAIIWGGNYYRLTPSRGWLAWMKRDRLKTLADFELAWTNFDRPARVFESTRNAEPRHGHATEKPVRLMQWCIEHAGPTEMILDPFCGSGSTLVAARILGRRAIGIEINPAFCEIAAERINAVAHQTSVFDP